MSEAIPPSKSSAAVLERASLALARISAWLLVRDEQSHGAGGAGIAICEDLQELYRYGDLNEFWVFG